MTDLLVKLYKLPLINEAQKSLPLGVEVRRAFALEKHLVTTWVAKTFNQGWASECEVSFSRQPIACFIATFENQVIGFCSYDSTARGVLGPMGIREDFRGKSVGSFLLTETLKDMRSYGYSYAIIGWADAHEFYSKVAGATVIEGSEPGMYKGLLDTVMDWKISKLE